MLLAKPYLNGNKITAGETLKIYRNGKVPSKVASSKNYHHFFPKAYLKDKTKLEELVSLFGGIPVDYQEREACCGWGASQLVLHPKEALKITYKKLKSAENVKADFMLMPCPTCLYTLSKPDYREKMGLRLWFKK